MLKNKAYLMAVVLLSSLVGASCFNESSSSEDLEIGGQLIDVAVCKGIEVRDNMGFILPVLYFLFIIMLVVFAILTAIFVFKVIT